MKLSLPVRQRRGLAGVAMPVLWKRLCLVQLVQSLLLLAARRSGKLRTTKLGAQTKLPVKEKILSCPGNYSDEDMSWLDAIGLEDLEGDDFCVARPINSQK